jgi:hypothetical protein
VQSSPRLQPFMGGDSQTFKRLTLLYAGFVDLPMASLSEIDSSHCEVDCGCRSRTPKFSATISVPTSRAYDAMIDLEDTHIGTKF